MSVDAKEKKQKFTQWVQSLENETNEDPDDFETMESDGKKRKNIRITIFILILLAFGAFELVSSMPAKRKARPKE